MITDIGALETLDLRQRVLRPFATREECIYACDQLPETRHRGIRDTTTSDSILAILTMTPEAPPFASSHSGLRIRGVAVDPDHKGKGYGSLLLDDLIQYVQQHQLLLWCNARLTAKPFYEKHGFTSYGDVFLYPSEPRIGDHIVMYRDSHLS